MSQGHSFTIVASKLSYLTGQQTTAEQGWLSEEDIDGVRVFRVATPRLLHRSFAWRVAVFLSFMVLSVVAAMQAGPVNLVIGTSPPIFQAVSACLVAALRRRPFLLEIRDLWPDFAIAMGVLKNPLLIALSRWLERFLYSRATHLLVNSPAYRDYLIVRGVAPDRVTLIANGVDPDPFDPAATGERQREHWDLQGKFVVTYAGALGLANDIPVLLEAADRLRDDFEIRFLLVGDGKERANLEAAAHRLGLPNVTFTGPCPKSDVPEVLAASDACVAILQDLPMFRTTYPNKVFDYMAAGRPTILAIDGVIRQVVEAANGGIFVPPGDAKALAEAVYSLSKDRSRSRSMGCAARSYVVQHFNRHDQAMQFLDLVCRVGGG